MKKIFILSLALIVGLTFGNLAFAQDNLTQENSADETTPQVFTKQRETQRIQELRNLYRDLVEVYRTSQRQYLVSKTNYEQVQTLSALEEAVSATRTVMNDRLNVMVTYTELIDAVLVETNGIELDLKDQTHAELTGMINLLKIHQENVILSKDRQAMAILSDDFEPIAAEFESLVYKTISLIRIGKIQEVHDKAEIIEQDIISQHEQENVSALTTSKRERAYSEIERNFDDVNASLAIINEDFLEARRDGFKRGFYENVLQDLSPIYIKISRSLDNLSELIKL